MKSRMIDTVQDPGDLEGEPYGEIAFMVEKHQNTARVIHQIDCNLAAPLIGGLKEDFADLFGIPRAMQKWYLNSRLLNDCATLWVSGIQCTDRVTEIRVTGY